MSFREHATTETSALVTRLQTVWSERSRGELESLRAALNAAAEAAETALTELNADAAQQATGAVIEELTTAAQLEVEAAVARVSADSVKKLEVLRRELQSKVGDLAKATAALETSRQETAGVKSQLDQQIEATNGARASLQQAQEAHARLEKAQQDLHEALKKAEKESDERLTRVLRESDDHLRKTQEQAELKLKDAQDAAQALLDETEQQAQAAAAGIRQEKTALEALVARMSGEIEQARAEASDIMKQLETEAAERAKLAAVLGRAQSQGQNADAERKKIAVQLETVQAQVQALERSHAELEKAKHAVEKQLERAASGDGLRAIDLDQLVKATAQPLDRLLNAFQKLEQSRTVRDVLSALVDGLASEFARVAVFEITGNHLEGLRQLGFESERDMSKVVIPLTLESLLTEAVSTGRIQSLSGSDLNDGSRALFGGDPSFILVLPIAVGDEVLAVVYADNSEQTTEPFVPQNHVKFAQLLLWHAVPRLPRLVREQRERAEMQDYAAHLVQQIQETYDADVRAGRKGDELSKRIVENLKCAKDMFTSRSDMPEDAEQMFDERLTVLLDDVRATPFGRDLATASGRAKGGRERSKQARHVG